MLFLLLIANMLNIFNESGVKVCKFKARQLGITATQESQLGRLGLPPGPSFSKAD